MVRNLGRLVTISAKIPEELKRRMDELGIKPSKIIRKAIEDEVKREDIKRLKEMVEEAKSILEKLSVERAVRFIREDRDSR